MIQRTSQPNRRPPNKLATTQYVAEVIDWVEGRGSQIETGQDEEPLVIGSAVKVRISSAATRGGAYNGKLLHRQLTLPVDSSGTLSDADFGDAPASDDTFIINQTEKGATTHDLISSPHVTDFIGVLDGVNADGKYVVTINGYDWQPDCPTP